MKPRLQDNLLLASTLRTYALAIALTGSKESHITTYLHLLLASGLPFTNIRIPELDYCSHCTIELWEKTTSKGAKDFSIRLSISEGAHSPAVLDSSVDARHSLTVQPRKKLTSHVDFDLAYQCFSKHFSKDLNFSTTPLEVSPFVPSSSVLTI
jgi:hypothetical protein